MCLDSPDTRNTLTPGLVGLLVLGAGHALLRAPVDAHDDVCPRATEMQLSLLARLAHRQDYWPHYLHILHFINANQSVQNTFNASLCSPTVDWPAVDIAASVALVQIALERWIVRADSLTEAIDRRCYALACLQSLAYCAQPYPVEQIHNSPSEEQLEQWALRDPIHSHWLEPVITSPDHAPVYTEHPAALATDEGLRKTMLSAFSTWQSKLGGEQFANALLRSHVDPALIGQLQAQLNRS
ncbi:unnamed protein product [Echinostoma caproni]|uniref:Secreted protein n=1 Tax=Echinostoma caproni TaxID=27848 RepID=A0A183B4D7_9TREM|nr:unnamed protein product [Echinostoma caproni]